MKFSDFVFGIWVVFLISVAVVSFMKSAGNTVSEKHTERKNIVLTIGDIQPVPKKNALTN